MTPVVRLNRRDVRRLALVAAGLFGTRWSRLPQRAGIGRRARRAAHAVIEHFGYLQLDSVSVAGARTHGIVLASRLENFSTGLAEDLLQPGEPLFEYWGHEASWLPMDLYPALAFRRRALGVHPWWGDLLTQHSDLADQVLRRIADDGPTRSSQLNDGMRSGPWWGHGPTKKVLSALWSSGDLAISERRGFQRVFDLPERVIPDAYRNVDLDLDRALEILLLRALDGHGWASTSTLVATWRLAKLRSQVQTVLEELRARGEIVPATFDDGIRRRPGWLRPAHLELIDDLRRTRPRRDRGVLLSPFDPVLWDRQRVALLFDFEQKIEIYKPADERVYGYYCLPILAGEQLIGRVDLKAHRGEERLEVRSLHMEAAHRHDARSQQATRHALERYGDAVGLGLDVGDLSEESSWRS